MVLSVTCRAVGTNADKRARQRDNRAAGGADAPAGSRRALVVGVTLAVVALVVALVVVLTRDDDSSSDTEVTDRKSVV